MKRNFVALGAVIFAIALSSFTTRFVQFKYFVYTGGTEKNINNYSQQASQPAHIFNTSTQTLNWFRVSDVDEDGSITTTEFENSFETYDVVNTSLDLLKDESADVSGQLDLKNKP
jgi:hypothetical protein